jgi:SHS2 domain-containing protein
MPERKITYEPLEHKTNSGFLVRAPSLQRLYIDAGLGLTDHIARLDTIAEIDRKSIEVAGDNREGLMVCWLSEILRIFKKEKFLAHRIVFNAFDGKKILASLYGETYRPTKHGAASEIKGVANPPLEIGQTNDSDPMFFAKIFLDV